MVYMDAGGGGGHSALSLIDFSPVQHFEGYYLWRLVVPPLAMLFGDCTSIILCPRTRSANEVIVVCRDG